MTRIFTFYTRNTPYEREAKQLVEAFDKFLVTVKAVAFENCGDWMKNILKRASLIEEIRQQHPVDHIVSLDADVRPLKPPFIDYDWGNDFACEDRGERCSHNRRYSAGVMMFGCSDNAREFLRMWAAMCRVDPHPGQTLREQYYLYLCIRQMRQNRSQPFNVYNIGNCYNRKPEDVKQGDDTVLMHDVASRRHLSAIGGKR